MSVPRYIVAAMNMTHSEDRGAAKPYERYVVLDTDHVADKAQAVAEAEQRVRDEERSHFQEAVWTFDRGHTQGRAEALRQAREAVTAECIAHHGYTPGQTCPYCTDALAAIDALKGEQT